MSDKLKELAEICAAATQGPWGCYSISEDGLGVKSSTDDIAFIFAARKYMPLLIELAMEAEEDGHPDLGRILAKMEAIDEP